MPASHIGAIEGTLGGRRKRIRRTRLARYRTTRSPKTGSTAASGTFGNILMATRLLILMYASASYTIFVASILYALGFFLNSIVPKSIDVGGISDFGGAVVVDLSLLGIFAIQHSIMARSVFKHWWANNLPLACQRSTYVLVSSLVLLLLFWQWRPIPVVLWRLDGISGSLVDSLYWAAWLLALASTCMIDHFELFGLRQAFFALRETEPADQVFRAPLLYRFVRHPLMLSLLLAFWATTEMTAGHLLFAVTSTLYVIVGVKLEERDLIAQFGSTYRQYRQRVPMLAPRIFSRSHEGESR